MCLCRQFFLTKKTFLDSGILSILEIVRISGYAAFGTFLERRVPENDEFGRYSNLQIPHGEPVGEQNDELNFGRLDLYFGRLGLDPPPLGIRTSIDTAFD